MHQNQYVCLGSRYIQHPQSLFHGMTNYHNEPQRTTMGHSGPQQTEQSE